MTQQDVLSELIETGRQILAACSRIQDTTGFAEEFPLEERREIADQLASKYHTWYAKAQASLPESDTKELTKLYEGNLFISGIKAFLSEPLARNPLHNEQTAQLIPMWLHAYAKAMKSPMLQQIMILERRLQHRPAVIKVSSGEIRLPRNLKGHQISIERFLEKNPFEKNLFLMMKYRDGNQHVSDIIRAAVENAGLKLWLASEVRITDELATNVVACLICCKYGIALFDEPEDQQHINPNVAYELGMMHLLDRDCLLLKSKNVTILSDILAKLYVQYDPLKPGEIISLTKKWLIDVGATAV